MHGAKIVNVNKFYVYGAGKISGDTYTKGYIKGLLPGDT